MALLLHPPADNSRCSRATGVSRAISLDHDVGVSIRVHGAPEGQKGNPGDERKQVDSVTAAVMSVPRRAPRMHHAGNAAARSLMAC